jgi:type I restriction enzyme S subunit
VGQISDRVTKGTTPTTIGRTFTDRGVKFIKVETIAPDGRFIVGREAYIDADTHVILRRSQLVEGDILFSIAGALGRTTIVEAVWLPANTNQAFAIIRPSCHRKDFESRYLLWQLRSPAIARKIAEINVRAAQANLSLEQVRNFEIPLVSQAEQRAIAAALDDIEDLTANLERMIAKKQAIKQGMMQQLLTGRTRLPGFTEPWREVRLGDVLAVRHGRSQKAVESPAGQYPILATGGQIGWATSPLYSKPSVLIGRKGTIDRPQYQETPFWTVDTLFYTEISTSADPRYMYYLFTTVDWQSMNEASGVPSLSSSRVEGVDVQLPGVDEQRAIRSMLDDADAEATALEVRLKKTQAIKQGMMQQLLTGRTRLPVKEDAA